MSALESIKGSVSSIKGKNKETRNTKYISHFPNLGFTLIELLIAISIIAIISAVGLVSYSQSQKLARDSRRKQDLRSIAVALELYRQKNGRYPCNGWAFSTTAGTWITDVDYDPPSTACGGDKPALTSDYINSLPKDPINVGANPWTAGNYIYGYRSYDCVTNGQYYFLLAQLENVNDPDRVSQSGAKWCDGTNIYQHPSSGINVPSSFVISSY